MLKVDWYLKLIGNLLLLKLLLLLKNNLPKKFHLEAVIILDRRILGL